MCTFLIKIPTKYEVAEVIGHIKGNGAIAFARHYGRRKRNYSGEQFWARGYAVSMAGFAEEQIQKYIRHREQLDAKGYDQDAEKKIDDDEKTDGRF